MKITWGVEDGYVGKSRPHVLEIPDNEISACCDTVDEVKSFIEENVQSDFDNTVSWVITDGLDEDDMVALMKKDEVK